MAQFQRFDAPMTDPRRAVREGGARGVYLACEHLLGAARADAPRDEHTLQRSGAANTDGLRGVVSFDTPYAVIQHEELGYNHPRGGRAKYLEANMASQRSTMHALIQQAVKSRMAQA